MDQVARRRRCANCRHRAERSAERRRLERTIGAINSRSWNDNNSSMAPVASGELLRRRTGGRWRESRRAIGNSRRHLLRTTSPRRPAAVRPLSRAISLIQVLAELFGSRIAGSSVCAAPSAASGGSQVEGGAARRRPSRSSPVCNRASARCTAAISRALLRCRAAGMRWSTSHLSPAATGVRRRRRRSRAVPRSPAPCRP